MPCRCPFLCFKHTKHLPDLLSTCLRSAVSITVLHEVDECACRQYEHLGVKEPLAINVEEVAKVLVLTGQPPLKFEALSLALISVSISIINFSPNCQ